MWIRWRLRREVRSDSDYACTHISNRSLLRYLYSNMRGYRVNMLVENFGSSEFSTECTLLLDEAEHLVFKNACLIYIREDIYIGASCIDKLQTVIGYLLIKVCN